MTKLNTFLKENNYKIIITFLFLCPIIDVLTSFFINVLNCNFTIGIFIKMLLIFYMLYYMLIVNKSNKIKKHIYLLTLIVYFILYLFLLVDGFYFYEMQFLFKTFFFPISILFFFSLDTYEKEKTRSSFIYLFIVYVLILIIPVTLNLGFNTYDIAKKGSIGFFNSANEIGGILSILFPFFFYDLIMKKNKFKFIHIIFLLLYIYCILNIGTKAPVLALILTVLFMLCYKVYQLFKNKDYKKVSVIILSSFFILLSFIIIIPKTNFYKNIKIHMNHFNINNVYDIFTSYENLDNIIFSERLSLLNENYKIFSNSTSFNKLLGITHYDNSKELKTVEIDFFDIYIYHGIIGFIIYFIPLIYIITNYIKGRIKFAFVNLVSSIIGLLLVFFTGHIIIVPSVSFIFALILCSLNFNNKGVFK